MPDFNPTVLRRMLTLRQFPIFASAGLDELATMAENVVSARFAAGTVIAREATRLPAIQLVIDGRIESRARGQVWGPRKVFGVLEVAAGRELAAPAIAVTDTETLELSASDFGEVLEDNFSVLLSALRDFARRMIRVPARRARHALAPIGSEPLGLVQRLILLRNQLPFAMARLHALSALAHASDEQSWPAGSTVVHAGDPATHGLVVVDGSLVATVDGTRIDDLGPGDPIGFLEMLAGTSHTLTVEATTPVRVLRSSETALHDVLEDHTDVGLAMVQTFAASLLDSLTN